MTKGSRKKGSVFSGMATKKLYLSYFKTNKNVSFATKLEGGKGLVAEPLKNNFFAASLWQYKTGIFVLLKQCYNCANTGRMVNLTPTPKYFLFMNFKLVGRRSYVNDYIGVSILWDGS